VTGRAAAQRAEELSALIADAANERTRAWWNRYLKGAIDFHGVPMAEVRRIVHAFWRDGELDRLPRSEQVELVLALFARPVAEEKLAAILVLSEILLDELTIDDVPFLATPFERGHIADWSTCDWYCVKVLGRFIARSDDPPAAAAAIAEWRHAPNLWQRRAAAVAFVNLAPSGDAAVAGLTSLVLEVCAANARDPERFSQTSVGWVLRELSHAEPAAVAAFAEQHADVLSREALRMATAKLPEELRRELNPTGKKR
jgi:3-methyladenine DNA glycosylase AlkD